MHPVPITRRAVVTAAVVLGAAVLAVLPACTSDGDQTGADDPVPTDPTAPATTVPVVTQPAAEQPPGTLIEALPVAAPDSARAWRIAYHSRAADGRDIPATGLLVVPDDPTGPLVVWGHPTTGTADACAPSLDGVGPLPPASEALARGWSVVAPDFEGLGTEGPHPYLVGDSAGHTMLDAARAAARVDDGGVDPAAPVALWGFSQGGHAALFAAELAPEYAPDLDVVGVAAVAPVGDPRQFWDRAVARHDQVGVAAVMAQGLAAADPSLDPADVLTDEAQARLDELEGQCIGEVVEALAGPVEAVVDTSVDQAPGWAAALKANAAGRRPVAVPVLLVQGDADDIVYPEVADQLADRLCAAGAVLEYEVVAGAGHGDIGVERIARWIEARFAGDPPPANCL